MPSMSAVFTGLVLAVALLFGVSMMEPEPVGQKAPVLGEGRLRTESITTNSLTITDNEGKPVINMSAVAGGGGLWISRTDDNGPMIAIYTIKGQAAIGLYESKNPGGAMPLALCLDKDGRPLLQVCDPKDRNKTLRQIDLLNLPK